MATQSSVSGEAIIIGPQQFFYILLRPWSFFVYGSHGRKNTHIYIYIYNIKKYLFMYAFIFNSLTIV